ncbi:MAG: sigma-70 family RNA polymerase sigma factor [Myxococcales bacterium]|nr:sigma-70 family RNA polymerase sigma factor [Myxococcales bacterium]
MTREAASSSAPATPDESGELVGRVQRGDQTAFTALFSRHRGDVARLIQRMIGPHKNEVEDLVQDVFLQVHRSIGDFRAEARFSTWLYRITVNVVLMNRRALKSRPKYADEQQAAPAEDHEPLPDAQAARNQRVRAFYSLLEHLSEKKRQVFVLHELEGISPQEISEIVDAPVLTVRTRLFYARKELAELLLKEPCLAALASGFERSKRSRGESAGDE